MQIAFEVLICFIAGMGAGLGTGFAGLSAAAVISPMLITFLGFHAYEAIGIALASDILASAVSAYTYWKSKNIDIKNGIVMLISVLIFLICFCARSKRKGKIAPGVELADEKYLSFIVELMLGFATD